MGLFQRNPTDPASVIERDVLKVKRERESLGQRLAATEQRLVEAIGERRQRTAAADDTSIEAASAKVFAISGVRDDLAALVAEADERIARLERDLVIARDKSARDAEAAALLRNVDVLTKAIEEFRVAGARWSRHCRTSSRKRRSRMRAFRGTLPTCSRISATRSARE
jgi:hypothetical protein